MLLAARVKDIAVSTQLGICVREHVEALGHTWYLARVCILMERSLAQRYVYSCPVPPVRENKPELSLSLSHGTCRYDNYKIPILAVSFSMF